jgi:hypothetical protein
MIRRLALILALLSPAAAFAQIAGNVLILPAAFGINDCTSTSKYVTFSWTSSLTPVAGDVYRVFVSSGSTATCPSTGTPAGYQYGGDIPALTTTQGYPVTGTLSRATFILDAGVTTCPVGGTSTTLSVCVQHVAAVGSTVRTTATGSVPLELKLPPVPINVSAQPGDASLLVSWADGTEAGSAPTSYRATATDPLHPSDTKTASTTGKSVWVTGLTNGVTYTVTVIAVSAGSNESGPSTAVVTGTPQVVNGFWEQYKADPAGREVGGCGGGPAGLVSLLGVALAMRGLRRRS